jgi:hypothetical protein
VLTLFEGASSLVANLSKSHVYPINCSDEQISLVRSILSCSITEFLCTYLGVPLSINRIPKAALHPLVNNVARRLPLASVTPGFIGKHECINTCAPGSSFTHVLTQ